MDSELRTLQSFKLLLDRYSPEPVLSNLTISRMNLLRDITCANDKDRKFLIDQMDKIDKLIRDLSK